MKSKINIKAADIVTCVSPGGHQHTQALVISIHKRLFGQPLVSLVFARECYQNEAGYSPHQFILSSGEELKHAGLPHPSRFDLREIVVMPLNEIGTRIGIVDLKDPDRKKRYDRASRAAEQIL